MAGDNRALISAILSLLVAADQRCPAIIGQAHLLYHSRPSLQPPAAAKTLVQLKRDADDLIRAIAEVEAAMKYATGPTELACGQSDQSDLRRQPQQRGNIGQPVQSIKSLFLRPNITPLQLPVEFT